ncbi:MAG: hypothetical protein KKD44_00595 [Proteobacteria bacterium]|nr:hypothetical protein [Pseudomonadota bacterium]
MISTVNKNKLSVSKATSTLISLILQMPPKEIMETLHLVEKKYNNPLNGSRGEAMVEVVFSVDKRFCKGIGRSITSYGMFIETTELFCTGESITLTFEHRSDGRQIKAKGHIATVAKEGINVAFDSQIEKMAV